MRSSAHTRLLAWLLAATFAATGSLVATNTSATIYPLQASANGRYLVDQTLAPYLMTGDAPQALTVNVSEAEAEMYFANRSAYGFNTLWVNLLCATYTGGRADGSTFDGILPFTGTIPSTSSYDLETPNEAFFARVDRLIELAARYDIQLLLDPIETGSWLSVMLDNGTTKCRNYGRYLGNRYQDFDNLIWMSGNDYQGWRDPANDEVVRAVALGIRDKDTRHLHTIELDYLVSSSLDDTSWSSILGLNATYTYYPTYARLREDYNRPNFLPIFMVEANYEFESLQGPVTTAPILRKQEYWTMTSGATGQLYGNGYTWPFIAGWQSNLDTPGRDPDRDHEELLPAARLVRPGSRHEPWRRHLRVRHVLEQRIRRRQRLSHRGTNSRRRAGGRLHADPPHVHGGHDEAERRGHGALVRSERGDVRHRERLAASQHRVAQLHAAREQPAMETAAGCWCSRPSPRRPSLRSSR